MQLHIVSVGHRPPAWAKAACEDYGKRFPRPYKLKFTEIPTPNRQAYSIQQAKQVEWDKMQRCITPQSGCIALDERGKNWSSQGLADALTTWQTQHKQLIFFIGGPDGLHPACQQIATAHWSLSQLTFPHALARVMVTEQLYRAISLLNNHPYHRE